jgi:hypothetical protein
MRNLRRAASAVTVVVLTGMAAAETETTARTAQQWLAILEEQAQAEKAAWTAHWHEVMRGTALALEPYDGRPEIAAKFQGERRRLYDVYQQTWERRGQAVAEKLLEGDPIDNAEVPYRFLASGTLLHRYHRRGIKSKQKGKETLSGEESRIAAYARAVEKAGQEILIKGYQGGLLTAQDIDVLRDYALFIDIRCTGQGVLPCHLHLTRSRYAQGFRRAGEKAPDFVLTRMEPLLLSPDYQDDNPRDPVDILTPLAIREFLQIMTGVTMQDGKVVPTPYHIEPGTEEHLVRLRDFRDRQPVLMVFMNATDPWAWHGRIAPWFEALTQAIDDRIACFFVCTTIHDTRMPSMDFLSVPPRQTSYVHEATLEHRARICKMFYLGWPDCTTDYLLDDMAQHFRNEWMDQGGGAYIVLVDRNGTIAYADYHKEIPPHWGPQAVNFPYEFLTIRMNHLEAALADFFACDLEYGDAIGAENPSWRLPQDRDIKSLSTVIEQAVWMPAVITVVDTVAREIRVKRILPDPATMKGLQFWNESAKVPFDPGTRNRLAILRHWLADTRTEPIYTLPIEDHTDIFVNGHQSSLSFLEPGDRVGLYVSAANPKTTTLQVLQIRCHRFP